MKIVVCVDETESSKLALDKAVEFANNTEDVKILLVNSLDKEINYEDNKIIKESTDNAINKYDKIVNNLKERAIDKSDGDIDVETFILDSDSYPVQTVIDFISDKNIYQIFIGHRAMPEKHEKLYGSFAKEMISKSPVPVVVTTTK